MTDPGWIHLRGDELEWLGVWITDPPGQVVALAPKVGHVWVCDDAGTFHDVAIADLVVAEQGTLL